MKSLERFNIIQKFSFLSFLFVFTLSISAGVAISHYQKRYLLEREGYVTADFVSAFVRAELEEKDFTGGPSDTEMVRFSKVFAEIAKIPDIVNINVYNNKGMILWSPISEIVGRDHKDNKDFNKAVKGEIVVSIEVTGKLATPHLLEKYGNRLLEVYVPIYWKDSNYIIGVIGTYKTAEPLFENMRKGVVTVWLISTISGLLLYISLFWLFKRAYNREIEGRNKVELLNKELSGINRDLEDRVKERTRQVIQMEKLSAVGEMMGEISHQLNNPMVGVVNYAQLAMRKIKKGVLPEKELETIEKAGSECKDIIQRLLAFYRHSYYEPVKTDINKLIEETLQLIGKQLSVKNIKIKADYSKKLPDAMIDQALMKQVFFNIINNARQAMPDGGDLAIKSYLANNVGREELCIEFSDTGSGIKKENLDQIFSPFFTTKGKEEGTGLGLSVAREIVVKHGGGIEVESEEGKGTTFYVKLPVS